MIELASALGTLKERPKRSILFATWFGEEKGLLGSRYFGRNPVIPIEKIVADLNLEQVGRTDDTEGAQVSRGQPDRLRLLGGLDDPGGSGQGRRGRDRQAPPEQRRLLRPVRQSGPRGSGRSRAHTFASPSSYPDYHGARRPLGQARLRQHGPSRSSRRPGAPFNIADNPAEPKWDAANPKAAKYLKAWSDRFGK